MGKRGPKTLPTKMKIVKGTLKKSRVLKNELQADPITRLPSPPEWICVEGKMEWAVMILQLDKLGILAECDMSMFASYCDSYGKYIRKTKEIEQFGDTSISDKGLEYEHPRSYLAERYRKAALQIATQFGFTPSSRTGISVSPKANESPLEALMKKAK